MPERGGLLGLGGSAGTAVNLNNLVGDKLTVNGRLLSVQKRLGEGGFAFVFLVRDVHASNDGTLNGSSGGGGNGGNSRGKTALHIMSGVGVNLVNGGGGGSASSNASSADTEGGREFVLKVTSIQNREQRDIAEKEAVLLRRLSHPSIVTAYDECFRAKDGRIPPQHMILMEYCEQGHAMDVIQRVMATGNSHFSVKELIVSFGQICNAVSYLHAQKPHIVHRDLKLENFLVAKGGAQFKLCDFGSAVFGDVPLLTQKDRTDAEEIIHKTTTQMYRAPEMIDLYMCKRLTRGTDVWALGCCLYTMAFFQNCFEEGSNLAILARNFKIPEEHAYPDALVELIDRMLTLEVDARADMTEVITCLSAIYSRKPLPPGKSMPKYSNAERRPSSTSTGSSSSGVTEVAVAIAESMVMPVASSSRDKSSVDRERANGTDKTRSSFGTYRTDGQGIRKKEEGSVRQQVKKLAKKLDPNSAAARRRAAMKTGGRADAQQQRTLSPVRSHSLGADGGADQPQSLGTPQSFGKVAERGVSPSSHYRNSKSEPRRESMRRAQSGTEVQSQFGFLSERTVPRRKHRQGSATSGTSQHAINDAQFDALFDGSFRAFSSSNNPFVVSGDKEAPLCDSNDPFDLGSGTCKKGGTIPRHNKINDMTSFPSFDESAISRLAALPLHGRISSYSGDGFSLSGAQFPPSSPRRTRSSSSTQSQNSSNGRRSGSNSRPSTPIITDTANVHPSSFDGVDEGEKHYHKYESRAIMDKVGDLEPNRTFEEV